MLLVGGNPDSASMRCTGTMIGCNTFLTAAHCVCLPPRTAADCQGGDSPNPEIHWVFLQHAGLLPVSQIELHPDYVFPIADLAVLRLGAGAVGLRPAELQAEPAELGSAATIVGFGRPTGLAPTILGIKRDGAVVTIACEEGETDEGICWNFVGPGSNTCLGDSGGPLYTGQGLSRRLAGTTSGGVAVNCLAPDHSNDVNLLKYREWILAQTTEKPALTSCGVGAQVDSPDVSLASFQGELASIGDRDVHSFEVPAGLRELRVGFNGRIGSGANFHWFVRAGAEPNMTDFDCSHELSRQSGLCRFERPEAGTWHVSVQSISGSGEYQVVSAGFADVPSCGDPDGNGRSTAGDAFSTLRAAVGLDECAAELCDVDGNGEVSAGDAAQVLRFAVGLVAGLACPGS
jgi:hypothetical protein